MAPAELAFEAMPRTAIRSTYSVKLTLAWECQDVPSRWFSAMDVAAWALLTELSLITLAGVLWRWVRVLCAILLGALCISLLEIMPGAVARSTVVDIANTSCAECRNEILIALVDNVRGAARTIMVPLAVLGVWAVVGDRWSGSQTTD